MTSLLETLRDRFSYDAATGLVSVRRDYANCKAGYVVGTLNNRGYLMLHMYVCGKTKSLSLHRIAWALHHGDFPPIGALIDHINRVRTDNRILNLRLVSPEGNARNSVATRKPGNIPRHVYQVFKRGKLRYEAGKRLNGKQYYIGIFDTVDEAVAAVATWKVP